MQPPASDPPAASPSTPGDYAHGRAALLLVESLIHGLIARSVFTVADGVWVMELALDAQRAIIEDAASPPPSMGEAATLLAALTASLSIDLPARPEDEA